MSDFHDGDLVYVRAVGSATEITRVVTSMSTDGVLVVIGYETEFGVLKSEDLDLILGGTTRKNVEMYLGRRSRSDQ